MSDIAKRPEWPGNRHGQHVYIEGSTRAVGVMKEGAQFKGRLARLTRERMKSSKWETQQTPVHAPQGETGPVERYRCGSLV
jgi:hypothetical protein